MRLQPVVAVLHSLFSRNGSLLAFVAITALLIVSLFFIAPSIAQNSIAQDSSAQNPVPEAPSVNQGGYVARILNDSPEEVAEALRRVETLYLEGKLSTDANPIAIVLHGPEVEIFFNLKKSVRPTKMAFTG